MSHSLDRLVLDAQRGDRAAWESLGRVLRPITQRHVTRILFRYGPAEVAAGHVDDMVNHILMDLFDNLYKFDLTTEESFAHSGPSKTFFLPWFVTRVRHKVLDHMRTQRGAFSAVSLSGADTIGETSLQEVARKPDVVTPERMLAAKEIWSLVDRVLETEETLVLRLVYVNDKSLKDAGAALGMSPNTVASIHARALRKLAKSGVRTRT